MSNVLENNEIAADLYKLALKLNEYGLCNDVSPLNNVAQTFIQDDAENAWKYDFQKMIFNNVDEVGGRVPSDAVEISVSMSIDIEGVTVSDDKIVNPLKKLNLDIELDGCRLNPTTGNIDDLFCCWHLDLHIEEDGDGVTKYSHPIYHFAYGGNRMESLGDDFFGNSLVMPAPRLMYPPMDAVLGIDFILQNYFEREKIAGLISDPEYLTIVKNSQQRLWKPFFTSLSKFWENDELPIEANFNHFKLFPFLT